VIGSSIQVTEALQRDERNPPAKTSTVHDDAHTGPAGNLAGAPQQAASASGGRRASRRGKEGRLPVPSNRRVADLGDGAVVAELLPK